MRSFSVLPLITTLFLTACSGGGGSSPAPQANRAPSISSPAAPSVAENTTGTLHTIAATDPDGDTLTFSISGGADGSAFSIGAADGIIQFLSDLDFEQPTDADTNNVYELIVQVTDGQGGTATQNLTITVTDVGIEVSVTRVAQGLNVPLFMIPLPDGSSRAVVLEKSGIASLFDPQTNSFDSVNFLDVSGSISQAGEGGLLGLEFSPNFASDRTVYVHLNNASGDTEIRRYQTFSGGLDQIDPSTEDVILQIPQPTAFHNAGWLGFDVNGLLYLPTGDGAPSGDPNENAQDTTSLLGKVLRIDPSQDDFPGDNNRDYGIPASNPFSAGGPDQPEIFAIGVRNPYRGVFNPLTTDLILADVGQNQAEEINLLPIAGGGTNFGWDEREGTFAFEGPDSSSFTPPAAQYLHDTSGRSITGGPIYNGPVIELRGQYIFGDFVTNDVWTIAPSQLQSGQTLAETDFQRITDLLVPDAGAISSITSFGEDGNGDLYILTLGGDVFKVSPAP